MRGEPVSGRKIGTPKVAAPRRSPTKTVRHVAEELLIPPDSGEELWRELIFRLEVIRKDIGIRKAGDLETRLEKFRPQLPMVPGEADILAKKALVIVSDVAAKRQRPHRFRPKI